MSSYHADYIQIFCFSTSSNEWSPHKGGLLNLKNLIILILLILWTHKQLLFSRMLRYVGWLVDRLVGWWSVSFFLVKFIVFLSIFNQNIKFSIFLSLLSCFLYSFYWKYLRIKLYCSTQLSVYYLILILDCVQLVKWSKT